MKTLRYVFSGLILLSILLSSCVKETAIGGGEGQPVQITFRTGTRSGDPEPGEGDPADRYINSLRVLGYRVSDGTLAFNEFLDEAIVAGAEKRIDVVTGRFTVVFIANEHSDGAIGLDGLTLGTSTLSELDDISFSQGAFLSDNDIPMVRIKENVIIQGDKRLIDDGTSIDGIWEITMERLGVRIDLTLKLNGHTLDSDGEKKLSIKNVPNKVYLFQKNNYDEGTTTVTRPLSVDTDDDGNKVWRRIILPESMFSDKENALKAVELSLWIDGRECTALIGLNTDNVVEEDRDYTLPRNTYLDITATANPQQQTLDCSATIVPWNGALQNVIVDEPYYLYVAADELLFTDAEGSAEITAETNYDLTEDKQGYPKGIQVSMEGGSGWITDLEAVTTDNKNYKIKFKVSEFGNTPIRTASFRTAKIKVTAGNITKVINVTQALWGGHADILYFDPDDGNRLKIGKWDTPELKKDNYQTRMVFTKFGGVVGFTIEGTIWYNNYVKFNPTVTTVTGYGNSNNDDQNTLPRVPAFRTEDYSIGNIRDISSTDYHYYHNIKTNGRGDICQLVGLTAEEIRLADTEAKFNELLANRNAEYKDWRLPTARENASFVGGASSYSNWISWKNGDDVYNYSSTEFEDPKDTDNETWPYYYNDAGTAVKGGSTGAAGTPNSGRFPVVTDAFNSAYTQILPAAGTRENLSGKTYLAGTYGIYWSSTLYDSMHGYYWVINYSGVYPVPNNYYASGFSVRCVRPVNNHLKY